MSNTSHPADGSAFELLGEGIRRQLYKMGWPSLRPIQASAIRAYLQTDSHLLIMAETAGGKTEAAFLPVLSAIASEPAGSVRALYIGPLKALINDQFGRLEELCTYIDVPVHRWHGDVAASRKAALLREPGGVLLITPESLESLLINRTAYLRDVFGGLRAVVIDEVHAFLESERGLHLSSLLTRVRRYQNPRETPFRVLGLSATVGDVSAAQRYITPDAPERVTLITDASEQKEIQFRLHGYTMRETAPEEMEQEGAESTAVDDETQVMKDISADLVEHCRGHSNLVFANRKSDIEVLADLANEHCREAGLSETFLVHHGSLAREVREDTEQTMKSGRAMTTVCSSTLEMGIDIGSVRLVGQVGAPWSVASLKQRMGRGGRKDGEPRRLRLYITSETNPEDQNPLRQLPIDLLQAIAICELMLKKWVEPPRPANLDFSTLTHQIISTIAETGAITAVDVHQRLCIEGPFRAVQPAMLARLLRQLRSRDIIEQEPDGKLILGLDGEQIRSKNDFYAAFASRAEYSIIAGDRLLGTLPIETVPKVGEHIVFAARRWQVVESDSVKYVLYVVPSKRRQRPKFGGSGGEVHVRIRRAMLELLLQQDIPIYLDAKSAQALQTARAAARDRDLARRRIVPVGDQRCVWFTWTGTPAQRTLIAALAQAGVTAFDEIIAIECPIAANVLAMHLRTFSASPMESTRLAESVEPKRARKFDDHLDDETLNAGIASDRLDPKEAERVISESLADN